MFRSFFDVIWKILAQAVPARLVYFVALRVLHEAVDHFSSEIPPNLIPISEALRLWSETKLKKMSLEDIDMDKVAPVAMRAVRTANAQLSGPTAFASPIMRGEGFKAGPNAGHVAYNAKPTVRSSERIEDPGNPGSFMSPTEYNQAYGSKGIDPGTLDRLRSQGGMSPESPIEGDDDFETIGPDDTLPDPPARYGVAE